MGKRIIQQARGKGGPRYRSPSHRYAGRISHRRLDREIVTGRVLNIIHCPGHSAPLARVSYDNGENVLLAAPEGIKVGDIVSSGEGAQPETGNSVALNDLPEGALVHNIESQPGDGGKFVKASGTFARVITKSKGNVSVLLPSKKQKTFDGKCRANIGIIAGGGRKEKPLLKAGTAYYKMKARNKLWPKFSGDAMNAVDHPFGGGRSGRKGRPTITRRHAPAGAKAGMLRPRQTGRKKGRRVKT